MKLGTRDAGVMWNGVANNFAEEIEIVEVPYEYEEEIGVSVMGLSYTKNKAQVEKFLDFVEEHGKEVFAEFGYVKDTVEESDPSLAESPATDDAAN